MASNGNRFNVGGVLLARPFKIRRLGHFGFNATRMDESREFYGDLLGFKHSDVLDFGKMPQNVPWVLAALFLVLPLLILAAVSFTAALVLILLAVGIVVAIAKFDR